MKPTVLQTKEVHPYDQEKKLKEFLDKYDIVIQAWYPLGHGDAALLQEPVFAKLGEKYKKSPAQIILRWHIQSGNIVIPGSKNPAHIRDNFDLFDFALTEDEMTEIAALDQNTVYQAVQKNKPLFERVITVTGKSVAKPSNFLARIGTPMKQLIDACGGLPEDTGKIIGGGPMMGKALVNTEVPTAKGSSGILIMNQKEAKRGEVQPCIRCAKCVGACPMGLEPYLLSALAEHTEFEF